MSWTDGTLAYTATAITENHAYWLARATGEDFSELKDELKKSSLRTALEKRGIDRDYFFNVYYQTFDPFEAAKSGRIRAFDDALRVLPQMSGTKAIISNLSQEATEKKLQALGLAGQIEHAIAEYEKSRAKPTPFMARKLKEQLKEVPHRIINIGDDERDMEFGKALVEVLSPEEMVNVLIDRDGTYSGRPNYDIKIASLEEIQIYS